MSHGLPRSELLRLRDNTPLTVTLKVAFDGSSVEATAITFPVLNLTVRTQVAISLTAPRVVEANGNTLDFNNMYYADHATVEVPHFTGMAAGQTIRVRWEGRESVVYQSTILTVGAPGTIRVNIPRLEVVDVIGSSARVTYTVQPAGGGATITSPVYTLNVLPQPIALPAPWYSNSLRQVTVKYSGMGGHRGRVRWTGVVARDTGEQDLAEGVAEGFDIPAQWWNENLGREVLVNYSILRTPGSGERLLFSRVLRLQVR